MSADEDLRVGSILEVTDRLCFRLIPGEKVGEQFTIIGNEPGNGFGVEIELQRDIGHSGSLRSNTKANRWYAAFQKCSRNDSNTLPHEFTRTIQRGQGRPVVWTNGHRYRVDILGRISSEAWPSGIMPGDVFRVKEPTRPGASWQATFERHGLGNAGSGQWNIYEGMMPTETTDLDAIIPIVAGSIIKVCTLGQCWPEGIKEGDQATVIGIRQDGLIDAIEIEFQSGVRGHRGTSRDRSCRQRWWLTPEMQNLVQVVKP